VDSGVTLGSQPAVPLPPLDSDFFQWYYEQADSASPRQVYTGNQSWSNVTLTPSNGVIYVKGNVHLEGTVNIVGCLVAEGDINIGTNIWPDANVSQTQVGRLPGMMSRYGHILMMDPATINGMVYAQDDLTILSLLGKLGPVTINGAVYAQGGMFLHERTQITYVMPNPPGLSEETPLKVMCWDE